MNKVDIIVPRFMCTLFIKAIKCAWVTSMFVFILLFAFTTCMQFIASVCFEIGLLNSTVYLNSVLYAALKTTHVNDTISKNNTSLKKIICTILIIRSYNVKWSQWARVLQFKTFMYIRLLFSIEIFYRSYVLSPGNVQCLYYRIIYTLWMQGSSKCIINCRFQ